MRCLSTSACVGVYGRGSVLTGRASSSGDTSSLLPPGTAEAGASTASSAGNASLSSATLPHFARLQHFEHRFASPPDSNEYGSAGLMAQYVCLSTIEPARQKASDS